MKKFNSSRRIFLEKLALTGAALTVSGTITEKLFAGRLKPSSDRNPVLTGTDKKFVPVMITPFTAGGIPLGFYECPSPYKRLLTPALFKTLLETNRLLYHKDTSIDIGKVKAKLALIKNNRLEFYDAHTPNAMYSLQAGAKGMASIAGNFYPEILVWMCNNAGNPDKQQDVQWLQSELTKADPIISHHYPMSAKYFMYKRGLPILAISRMSPAELSPAEKQTLDDMHNTLMGWCQHLGIQPAG